MCLVCAATSAAQSTEDFAGTMLSILNNATTALMVSVGHRTGLFDAMAAGTHYTSEELARAASLDERYVREWLNAMTVARIVVLGGEDRRYHLPATHAHWLTRTAPEGNLAVVAQFIAVLGSVEDRIVECFKRGGGVPYEAFDRFHAVMAEESGQTVLPALVPAILPLVPGLTARLEAGIDVADIGCGAGRALVQLARAFPASRFTGVDFGAEAIALARQEGAGLSNLRFEQVDAARWDAPDAFDLVLTFDAVHDQGQPAAVLAAIARALKPGGVYLMQDIDASSDAAKNMDHPLGPTLYGISCMHCMTVSLAQGGVGLGAMWGRELAHAMLRDAGFGDVTVHRLPHDIQNAYWVCRR